MSLPGQHLPVSQDTSAFIIKLDLKDISLGRLETGQSSTAIVIKSAIYLGPSVPILINGDSISVWLDPDAPEYTYFLSHGLTVITIELPDFSRDVEVYLINSGIAPAIGSTQRTDEPSGCIPLFNTVPQSSWRAGLPSPSYTRTGTEVEHVVIHHSAGSNTNTDFTQVVRDIYIYHTQVNGWSDIGYNYLIAQDGSIYEGRDPGALDQDNVLGAHFCGSNSTTMGVCLLGNYETGQLTDPGFTSLIDVISWKLEKEDLGPYSKHQHALGYFDAIIGHKDGCSTLCPGKNVYTRIDEIKGDVLVTLNCGEPPVESLAFEVTKNVLQPRSTMTVSNQSTGYDSYEWIFEGGVPELANWSQSGIVNYNYPGIFDITLIGISEGERDTLLRKDHIKVEGELVVFPNPITVGTRLAIQYHQDILNVKLLTMDGMEFSVNPDPDGRYWLPFLKPGIYMLRIETNSGVVGRKMIFNN